MKGTHSTCRVIAIFASLALFTAPIAAIAEEAVLDGNDEAVVVQDDAKDDAEGNKKDPVTFTCEDGSKRTIDRYELLEGGNDVVLDREWYVVPSNSGTVSYDHRAEVKGTVNIVVGAETKLEFVEGIHLAPGNKLVVWSVDGKYTHGMLRVPHATSNCAGIGGNEGEAGGHLVVASGSVYVGGAFGDAAGIGGGKGGDGGVVDVYGGYLQSVCVNAYGAAIGGGLDGNGGEVYAYKKAYIKATASSGRAAGIGGGSHGNGGAVTINQGGEIYAEGGSGAAAIGGGYGGTQYYLKGGDGGSLTMEPEAKLTAMAHAGGAAVGAGEGSTNHGTLDYFAKTCVSKDEVAVDANERDDAFRASDVEVVAQMCEHGASTYDANEDGHTRRCTFCGDQYETEAHDFGDDDCCDTCGYQKPAEKPAVQMLGRTLVLDGKIGVNTYLVFGKNIADDVACGKYMVQFYDEAGKLYAMTLINPQSRADFDVNAQIATPIELKDDDGVTYTAYGTRLTTVAKEMGKQFTMRVCTFDDGFVDFADADGNIVEGEKGLTFSVNDVLDTVIAKKSGKFAQLARDMKAYGTYAKHYFDKRDNKELTLPEVEGFKTISADELGVTYSTPKNIKHFTYKGASLNLLDDTAFRISFVSDDASALKATVNRGGNVEELEAVDAGNGNYYFEVSNIAARRLGDMYEFTITNGSETTTFVHGPHGFVSAVLTPAADGSYKMSEEMRYVAMALYRFGASADAYFKN